MSVEAETDLVFCLQEADMGAYTCSVSAWSLNNQGNLVKVSEQQSWPLTVRWAPKRKDLGVRVSTRRSGLRNVVINKSKSVRKIIN